MIKAVTFFLIAILVLGMFGKLHWLGGFSRRGKSARKCPKCGGYLIGDGSCRCSKS